MPRQAIGIDKALAADITKGRFWIMLVNDMTLEIQFVVKGAFVRATEVDQLQITVGAKWIL